MARAFVTGGSGLIGRWLVQALLDRGDEVVVLGRSEPAASWAGHVELLAGDVRDADTLMRGAQGATDAFHLAGQALLHAASRSPRESFDVNVRGTWNLLEACLRAGVGHVLVASSQEAYGAPEQLPLDERQPLRATSPYGAGKAAAEVLCRSYWETYALPVCISRCANTYGGGDRNRSRLVPAAVCDALAGQAIEVRSDGSATRDFLYVEDAVQAMLRLGSAATDQVAGESFNVGGPQRASVLEVANMVCEIAGSGAAPVVHGTVPGEHRYLDCAKLARTCGWRPQTTLQEGLERTVAWYAERSTPAAAELPALP